jgi:hypothetical protein
MVQHLIRIAQSVAKQRHISITKRICIVYDATLHRGPELPLSFIQFLGLVLVCTVLYSPSTLFKPTHLPKPHCTRGSAMVESQLINIYGVEFGKYLLPTHWLVDEIFVSPRPMAGAGNGSFLPLPFPCPMCPVLSFVHII